MNPEFRKIKCYKFTWKKFGTLLMYFVKDNIEELEDIDLIISLKRGGSILGQSLACLIHDFSRKNTHPIKIRDVPSGIVYKDTIPTFINRLIASPSEINDLPKLPEFTPGFMTTDRVLHRFFLVLSSGERSS